MYYLVGDSKIYNLPVNILTSNLDSFKTYEVLKENVINIDAYLALTDISIDNFYIIDLSYIYLISTSYALSNLILSIGQLNLIFWNPTTFLDTFTNNSLNNNNNNNNIISIIFDLTNNTLNNLSSINIYKNLKLSKINIDILNNLTNILLNDNAIEALNLINKIKLTQIYIYTKINI